MNEEVKALKPARLWHYFGDILEIPRPSKKEEKIAAYLVEFGKKHGLETMRDEIGNVIIRKPATAGKENIKSVVLQSHIDMVCEKNSDKEFDFDNDPIEAYVEDGWVTANGTTLGADCGIGVALSLAILESQDIEHGPVECLFTVDEETGLTGAFGLDPKVLKSKVLLNLDSEDDGLIFIGCAGGKDTVAEMPYKKEPIPAGYVAYKVSVTGLKGGHSGDDIEKGLGNANKVLNRALWNAANNFGLLVSEFNAGNLRNAIAREGFAIVMIPENNTASFEEYISVFNKTVKAEFHVTDPDVTVACEKTEKPAFIMDKNTQDNLLKGIYACPHGVIAMSQDIDDFVETSTNLASVKFKDDMIEITTSQRSSVESAKEDISAMVASALQLAGFTTRHTDGYPGWTPNPNSEIVDITAKVYEELFKEKPEVLAVHAGLECGLIGDKYPEMDMVSYGPTIRGAHSPDEKIEIKAVERFWEMTLEILRRIPNN
ncbi:MAG: aminoacyl-histidine dipeptidase [Bacteroidales bacterium]|jgi:dipeptidase D|nr:aminoacyl-histidine dipeptidase [Bacteroidales bacterium]